MKEFKFRDIFGATIVNRLQGSMFSIDLHTFAGEEQALTGCCGCKNGKLKYPRVHRVTMLVVDNAQLAEEWRSRILWAIIGK